jgi:hypothetical protein
LSALANQERPNKLYCELISLLGKDSIDRVMELSKKYSIDEDGEIQFPPWVEGEALSKGWQKAFDYYKDCWKANNNSSTSSYNELPKDFNFQAFASAWAAHEKNLNFGTMGGFYREPGYLWQEWAKREPQAALDFFLSDATKTFDASDFLGGYAAVASSSDLYTVVSQIGIERPADLNRIGFFMRERLNKNAQSQLDFADWTIKSGDLSLAAAVMTILGMGSEDTGLKQRIVSSLPVDLRLSLAKKLYVRESNKLGIVNRDKTIEAMTAAGYTPVEIQSLLHGVK